MSALNPRMLSHTLTYLGRNSLDIDIRKDDGSIVSTTAISRVSDQLHTSIRGEAGRKKSSQIVHLQLQSDALQGLAAALHHTLAGCR